MVAYAVATGLREAIRYFEALPDIAIRAAVLAVNQVAQRDAITLSKKQMRAEVDFPAGYLEGGRRLSVTRRAKDVSIEAAIAGRDRPTSLARFAAGQNPRNTRGQGVRVQVKKGRTKVLRGAFMLPLRNGNIGVAVRLAKGETMRNTEGAKRLANNLYLLYGPSVDQVFRGVSADIAPELGRKLNNEFLRQFARLSSGV